MNKSSLFNYSVVTIILLLSLSSFTNVEVKVYGIIFIKTDGSIEGTNRIERKGNLYTFTSDIEGAIEINTDNIILDGAGYELFSNINLIEFPAATLLDRENVTIRNLSIRGFTNRYGAISIDNSRDTIIENNNITNIRGGIHIYDSQNIRIEQNNITDFSRRSIHIRNSQNIYAIGNNIYGKELSDSYGFYIGTSEKTIISQNNISKSEYGIEIHDSFENTLSKNHFLRNTIGIYIYYGGNNIVTENSIIENKLFGMELSSTSNNPGNIIYKNNFIDNNLENIEEQLQVSNRWFAGPESNTWDNGKEGNYWSDYKIRYPDAEEIGDSGVYNTAFFINPGNIDNYPLVNPWIPDTTPPIISVISPQNKSYTTANIPINCSINEAVEEITYSIDGQAKTTFTENFTLTDFSEGEHNLIIYATDIFGNVGSSATLFFTVDVPEPFPTNLIIASVAIIVVGLGILAYYKRKRS